MIRNEQLDCLVIGYNEMPIAQYEPLLRKYGEDSEAYRDLRFSFVDLEGEILNYVDLLNRAFQLARRDQEPIAPEEEFKSGDIPNLAAVYLTNYLRKRGFSAKYINLFQYEKERLAEYLDEDPLCVAITTTFYVLNMPVIEMIEFIRERNKKVKIVVGGPLIANHHRRYQSEELLVALEELGADIYVIESQGEWTLSQIVSCLKTNGDLGNVPNIIYNDGQQMHMTATQHENNSLDEDAIDWEGFSSENLGPTLQTRTARSCAFSCAFCAYPMRAGNLTLASLDTIKRELRFYAEHRRRQKPGLYRRYVQRASQTL